MSARLGSTLRHIWRAVRDAGPDGLSREALLAMLPMRPQRMSHRVHDLKAQGYIQATGRYDLRTYTLGNKVPQGERAEPYAEPLPGWILAPYVSELVDTDGDNEADTAPLHKPLAGAPGGVPNSVFALGQVAQQQAGETPAELIAAMLAPAAPEAYKAAKDAQAKAKAKGLAWVPAKNPQPAAAPQPAPASKPSPKPKGMREVEQAHVQPQPPGRATLGDCTVEVAERVPGEPWFELHSTGAMVLHPDAGPASIRLSPVVTRALFRWLDQLAGPLAQAMEEEGEDAPLPRRAGQRQGAAA
jgi:hypothetical protein